MPAADSPRPAFLIAAQPFAEPGFRPVSIVKVRAGWRSFACVGSGLLPDAPVCRHVPVCAVRTGGGGKNYPREHSKLPGM